MKPLALRLTLVETAAISTSRNQAALFEKPFWSLIFFPRVQKTASMATVELCPHSVLGAGFTLLVGLSEIHVPRMWVEEDKKGHHVSTISLSVSASLSLSITDSPRIFIILPINRVCMYACTCVCVCVCVCVCLCVRVCE